MAEKNNIASQNTTQDTQKDAEFGGYIQNLSMLD